MNISKSTGKLTAKLVKGITAAPKASGSKIKQIKDDLADGYREVVPAKVKTQ